MTARRDVCWLLVLFGVVAVPLAAQRTHEQRYFDWTALSAGFTFRQLDTSRYLTGLEMPDAIAAIDSDAGRTTLYAPPRDARFENASRRNDFPGRPLQTDAGLGPRAGLANIRPIARFETDLASWIIT